MINSDILINIHKANIIECITYDTTLDIKEDLTKLYEIFNNDTSVFIKTIYKIYLAIYKNANIQKLKTLLEYCEIITGSDLCITLILDYIDYSVNTMQDITIRTSIKKQIINKIISKEKYVISEDIKWLSIDIYSHILTLYISDIENTEIKDIININKILKNLLKGENHNDKDKNR